MGAEASSELPECIRSLFGRTVPPCRTLAAALPGLLSRSAFQRPAVVPAQAVQALHGCLQNERTDDEGMITAAEGS